MSKSLPIPSNKDLTTWGRIEGIIEVLCPGERPLADEVASLPVEVRDRIAGLAETLSHPFLIWVWNSEGILGPDNNPKADRIAGILNALQDAGVFDPYWDDEREPESENPLMVYEALVGQIPIARTSAHTEDEAREQLKELLIADGKENWVEIWERQHSARVKALEPWSYRRWGRGQLGVV